MTARAQANGDDMQSESTQVSETVFQSLSAPSPSAPGDADVDLEVLKSVPKAFAIDCEEHANWLVRKIVAARQYC